MENLDLVTWLMKNWYTLLTTLVVIASLFISGTNTPDPNSTLGRIYKIIEFLGLTFGKAKQTHASEYHKRTTTKTQTKETQIDEVDGT